MKFVTLLGTFGNGGTGPSVKRRPPGQCVFKPGSPLLEDGGAKDLFVYNTGLSFAWQCLLWQRAAW